MDFNTFEKMWIDSRLPVKSSRGTSRVEKEWLADMSKLLCVTIQGGGSLTEQKKLGRYSFDGYYETPDGRKIVLEFHGDYHHCNPKTCDLTKIHPLYKKLNRDILLKSYWREIDILQAGYLLFRCWESEYIAFKKKRSIGVLLYRELPGHWITEAEVNQCIDLYF